MQGNHDVCGGHLGAAGADARHRCAGGGACSNETTYLDLCPFASVAGRREQHGRDHGVRLKYVALLFRCGDVCGHGAVALEGAGGVYAAAGRGAGGDGDGGAGVDAGESWARGRGGESGLVSGHV